MRFTSEAALREGRGFTIMEVNGAGSEAIQAWDPATGLIAGLRTIFAKQRLLFEIGAANRRRGARPIGLLALARLNAAPEPPARRLSALELTRHHDPSTATIACRSHAAGTVAREPARWHLAGGLGRQRSRGARRPGPALSTVFAGELGARLPPAAVACGRDIDRFDP